MTPCQIIIFGATGDLTRRKLLPSLFELHQKGMPQETKIICVARRPFTDETFREYAQQDGYLRGNGETVSFLERIHYLQVDFSSPAPEHLLKQIEELGHENRIFYLAVGPEFFGRIAEVIKETGLLSGKGWKRIVFEKPFGDSLTRASQLNDYVSSIFSEDQIYRIDHYLGKELVQNIMVLRFANALFEQMWHKEHVDHVQITIAEEGGVGERGGYFDKAGMLRDMMQNHALQIISLAAMEPPTKLTADAIRDEQARVLRAIRRVDKEDIVLGQYEAGKIHGREVCGYTQEKGIPADSRTETFASVRFFIDNDRWKNIPFFVRTGKRLASRYAQVDLVLKNVAGSLFEGNGSQPNVISIRIHPDEGIAVLFNAKSPGSKVKLEPVTMDFCHHCLFGKDPTGGYGLLLSDVMKGDQTLFTRWDFVSESWKLTDHIRSLNIPVEGYPAGSMGPKKADLLLGTKKWL